ncbi:MAG TPA: DUF1579 family protein [Anaerolineales bacterium]|nr:DUF1579 family protein [Anaerolineales bacterium]
MTFPKPSSPHQFLAGLVGGWSGKTLTWLEPDGVPRQARTQGSFQLVLEGRFALYLYQTAIDTQPQHGLFTFGYNTTLDRWEASWIDSFHNNTGIMFCVGQQKDNGFAVTGNYPDPTGGPDWSWRTEVNLLDHDRLLITAYNISPEGAESKAVETQLNRVKQG